jgi:pantoate kinase
MKILKYKLTLEELIHFNDIFIFSLNLYIYSMIYPETSANLPTIKGDFIGRCTAFCPSHITGFFETPDQNNSINKKNIDFLFYGSKGAGFSLTKGVTTEINIYKSQNNGYQIFLNHSLVNNLEVSKWVVQYYLNNFNLPSYFIDIKHFVDVPIGYGLGTSGAAALSLSYALNKSLGIGLSKEEAAQIAHIAEIHCKTGLGTVIAEFYGGLEIRTSFGAPGIGKVTKVKIDNYTAVVLCISPILTKQVLNNYSNNANNLGSSMIEQLLLTKDVKSFLSMAHKFADYLGLTKGSCERPIQKLNRLGFDCSIALFGQTVFTLVKPEHVLQVASILRQFPGTLIISDIDNKGALIKNYERS